MKDSRALIRDIVALRPAPRRGFWLGNPHPDTWPLYHRYFGTRTEEELRLKLGDDFRWITPQYMATTYRHPAGKKIFADTCVPCHGDDAKGNRELGAPNLTDQIWLYGSGQATIVEGLTNGRAGVMPAWAGRLDPTTIKALAVYVHTFGGGEK